MYESNYQILCDICREKSVLRHVSKHRNADGSCDIEGSLLSGKMFDAAATTGDVRVPASDRNGGECKVHTNSGDIDITVR